MATSLKRFLSTLTCAEYSGIEKSNSDVIKSIIAVTASHKLISDSDKGKFMHLNPERSYTALLSSIRLVTLAASLLRQLCLML